MAFPKAYVEPARKTMSATWMIPCRRSLARQFVGVVSPWQGQRFRRYSSARPLFSRRPKRGWGEGDDRRRLPTGRRRGSAACWARSRSAPGEGTRLGHRLGLPLNAISWLSAAYWWSAASRSAVVTYFHCVAPPRHLRRGVCATTIAMIDRRQLG